MVAGDGFVVRTRRRGAAAPLRPAGRAGGDPRPCGQPRARGGPHGRWHERDAQSLVERFGATVFTPPPDTADDLVRKYGVASDQLPEGWHSPDVAWLLVDGVGEAHVYGAGDRLPIGVEAFPGRSHNDLVLWIGRVAAIVAGDSLVDFGRGFEVPREVLQHGLTREQVVEDLRPLLRLPVEVVLPTHGAPTGRAALERALS